MPASSPSSLMVQPAVCQRGALQAPECSVIYRGGRPAMKSQFNDRMKVNELRSNDKCFIFYLSARYLRTTPWVGSCCYSKLQMGKQAERGSVFPKVASLVRSCARLKASASCLLTLASGCSLSVSPKSQRGGLCSACAVRRSLSLSPLFCDSEFRSPVALLFVASMTWFYLGCCQSDRCGEVTPWQVLPCLSVESGVTVRGDWPREGEGEQRGAWEHSGCILGTWLVEALIHHPGCAQDWVHGILTVCTPSTKLVPLKTVAGKSFPPGFTWAMRKSFF